MDGSITVFQPCLLGNDLPIGGAVFQFTFCGAVRERTKEISADQHMISRPAAQLSLTLVMSADRSSRGKAVGFVGS